MQVLIDSCPLDGNFDQEGWVVRNMNWETLGPRTPNAFVQLTDSVHEIKDLMRQADARDRKRQQNGGYA